MEAKRIKVKRFPGVYYREHSSRKHQGKPDKCFDINYKIDGKLFWKKIGYASEGCSSQMASEIRGSILRDARLGEHLPKKKKGEMTFDEIWQKYSEHAKVNQKSFEKEQNRYVKHIKSPLGSLTPPGINLMLIEQFKDGLLKKGYAEKTVRNVLSLIGRVINKAILWEMWDAENPITKIKLPNPDNKRQRFLTPQEAELLLEELGKISPQWKDIAFLTLNTGLRAGEIFALKWGDINLDEKIITILDSKTKRIEKAFMNNPVREMLERRLAQKKENALPTDPVFEARKGKHIEEVSDTFKRIVERLGFNHGVEDRRQKVCFHSLRHTFASWLALEGVPILTIKELMRHSTLQMTERYAHLSPDHKREAINKIEEKMLFNSQNQPLVKKPPRYDLTAST